MTFPLPPGQTRRVRRVALSALAVALTLALNSGLPAFGQTSPSPLPLAQAVESATRQSRLLAAADAQTQAAREMAVAAGQLPDPVLKLGLNNLPIDGPERFSVTRDFMTMRSIGLMQEFTRADKLRARSARAQSEIEATRVSRQATEAELQRDAALAWLDRSFEESSRELLQAQLGQAELQVQAAESLYRAGKGSQADVFAARGEVEMLRDRIAEADRQVAVAITQLARWIGDEARREIAPRPALALPAWAVGDVTAHLDGHPHIATAAQQEALAESDVRLARTAQRSDWSVELMVSQRGPAYSNMLSINFALPLQWDSKQRQNRQLAARMAELDSARARRQDVKRAAEAELQALLQTWRGDGERLERYQRTLLPLAGQRSEAALAAYRAGTGSLPDVLAARRAELDLRLQRLRLEAERARLWARFNYLMPDTDHRLPGSISPTSSPTSSSTRATP